MWYTEQGFSSELLEGSWEGNTRGGPVSGVSVSGVQMSEQLCESPMVSGFEKGP